MNVQWREFIEGDEVDGHGNTVEEWADPVDRQVIGWAPPSTEEPELAGHNRDVVDLEMMVAADWMSSPRDRVTLPDLGQFEQIGKVETTSGNPFGWIPGHIVNLKQVNG
jgi:hypothetical protein